MNCFNNLSVPCLSIALVTHDLDYIMTLEISTAGSLQAFVLLLTVNVGYQTAAILSKLLVLVTQLSPAISRVKTPKTQGPVSL